MGGRGDEGGGLEGVDVDEVDVVVRGDEDAEDGDGALAAELDALEVDKEGGVRGREGTHPREEGSEGWDGGNEGVEGVHGGRWSGSWRLLVVEIRTHAEHLPG